MKLKCLPAAMMVALTSVNVMAQNVQSYQSQPASPPAQAANTSQAVKNPPVPVYQAPRPTDNMQVAEAQQPSTPTEGDIIDVNGNLKFVPRVQPGSSAAVAAAAAADAAAADAAASKPGAFEAAKADASGQIHPRINPESTAPTLPQVAPAPTPAPLPQPIQQPLEAPAPQVAPEPPPAPAG